MKRPIITERMFLYWTDREHPNTCRMTVRMQDAIELTIMQKALRQTDLETQQTTFRGITLLQNDTDTMAARFWQSKEGADRVDQMPTVAARHEVMKGLTQRTQTMTSCFISYVGKANFGAAERYIREMYTEVYSTHAMGAEISAIGGTFCISFMQLFTTDVYLDAFLDELRQLGIDCRIISRHPILVAPVADYRKKDTLTLK